MNQQKLGSPDLRVLAAPLYALSVMLILVPLSEVAHQTAWQIHPGEMAWRTGVVGILSSMTATPTFGLILAIITAYVCGHRRTLYVLTALAALATVLAVALVGIFVLDALQVRPSIREELRFGFTSSVVKALISFGITIVTLIITTVSGLRAARSGRATAATTRESGVGSGNTPLIVGGRH